MPSPPLQLPGAFSPPEWLCASIGTHSCKKCDGGGQIGAEIIPNTTGRVHTPILGVGFAGGKWGECGGEGARHTAKTAKKSETKGNSATKRRLRRASRYGRISRVPYP